jgi:hypothetical protein
MGRFLVFPGETSRPLEVHIKEHKYNLMQGLLEKSKLAQYAYEEGHKICWKEVKALQTELNTTYRKYKESTNMSLIDQLINTAWTSLSSALPLLQRKSENYNSAQGRLCVKVVFYVGTIQRIFLFSDNLYCESTHFIDNSH